MNDHDPRRPLGARVGNWTPPPVPPAAAMEGRYARLEPMSADRHAALLYRAFAGHDAVWDYLPYGPFSSAAQYHRWMRDMEGQADPLFLAIQDLETGNWGGVASFLRIAPAVAKAAETSGVATRPIADLAAYRQSLTRFVTHTGMFMRPVFAAARSTPPSQRPSGDGLSVSGWPITSGMSLVGSTSR